MNNNFLDGYNTYDTSKGYGNTNEWRDALYERMSKEQATVLLNNETQTPYSILGVSPQASATDIKKAFRQLIMQWHPDKNQHRLTQAEAMSKKIIAAYTLLQ